MMDRLTRRMCGGWGVAEGYELNTLRGMRTVVERLAAYEDTGLTPEEITAAEDRRHQCKIECLLREYNKATAQLQKFRGLYIEMVKKHADDICDKCANNPRITCGKDCPSYIEGDHGWADGKRVDFHWTCMDLDWGSCPRLEGSVCHGCYDADFANFKLAEEEADTDGKP